MITLQALTSRELAQVDAALDLLLDCAVIDEAGGVDLEELSEAVAVELEQREAAA